jgi:hypothetical protein
MQIAIIGAGVAGLAAARALRLRQPGSAITIYEKSRGLGGRAATRRRGVYAFDHGAQIFKAPGDAMLRLVREELPAGDLFDVGRPVWLFDAAGAIAEGDAELNAEPQWNYRDGINRLGKLLADGADVRREVRIGALRRASGAWRLVDEQGQEVGSADRVLLTAPAPQSAAIVAASDIPAALRDTLGAALDQARYRRCISFALAYEQPLDRPFYALLNADRRHPIAWLGLEHTKGILRCPARQSLLIAQLAPEYSLAQWETPAEELAPAIAEMVSALLGEDLRRPALFDRQGWRYALPDSAADADALAAGAEAGLFFAGDFLTRQGRVHLAIESGRQAAEKIADYRLKIED